MLRSFILDDAYLMPHLYSYRVASHCMNMIQNVNLYKTVPGLCIEKGRASAMALAKLDMRSKPDVNIKARDG